MQAVPAEPGWCCGSQAQPGLDGTAGLPCRPQVLPCALRAGRAAPELRMSSVLPWQGERGCAWTPQSDFSVVLMALLT